MKHIFNSIFLAGVGVMFSACAARDASPSGGGLTKHSSLAQPADASVTATSAVLQGTNIPRTTKMHPVEINAPLDLRPIPGTALDQRTVATFVPAVIYAIPASSPLHYVTCVQVYAVTPEFVYEGYTPGYLGLAP